MFYERYDSSRVFLNSTPHMNVILYHFTSQKILLGYLQQEQHSGKMYCAKGYYPPF